MVDKGLSRFIPSQVHDAHRPLRSCGWEMAALSYMAAVWLSVIGSLVLGFSISFHAGVSGLFLGSSLLFVGIPVTIVALTLVARLHGPQTSELGLILLDAALTLFFLLGVLAIVIGILGFIDAFTDSGFGPTVDDLFLHLADIALGIVGVVWALNEIATLKGTAAPDGDGDAGLTTAASPAGEPEPAPYVQPPATTPSFVPPPAPPTSTLPTVPPPSPPSPPSP